MNVPRVEMLRMHVLVMEFIGKDGWPAPRLKDAQLTEARLRSAYRETVEAMWVMYQKCKLVHADLSEYNMLYCDGHVVIIDVSQAVDLDHPRALVFLREDCAHVNAFFAQKNKVCTLSTRELFDFVTDPTITEANMEEVLDQLCAVAAERPAGALSAEDQVSEAVFRGAFIPQNLSEVVDFERDASQLLASASGREVEGIYYTTLTGMKVADGDLTVRQTPELLTAGTQGTASGANMHVENPEDSTSAQGGDSTPADESAVKQEGAAEGKEMDKDEDEDEDGDEDGEDGEGSSDEEAEGGEDADEARRRARKEHKKQVKAEKAEKRKTKIPKSEKKRKTKGNKKK